MSTMDDPSSTFSSAAILDKSELSVVIRPEGIYHLSDITIQCTQEDEDEDRIPAMMNVQLFGSEWDTGKTLFFEQITRRKWVHSGVIEMSDDLTFIAEWDDSGNFGRLHLMKTEFHEFKKKSGTNSNSITREFRTQMEGPTLTLTVEIYNSLPGEILVQKGGQESSFKHLASELVARGIYDGVPDELNPHHLYDLGTQASNRWSNTRSETDINASIMWYGQAAQLMPIDDPMFVESVYAAGIATLQRFALTPTLSDITQVISHLELAVNRTSDHDEKMPLRANNLGTAYRSRFNYTGELADISKAIAFHQNAIHLPAEGHPDLPSMYNQLGLSYECRFRRTGDLADLAQAISSFHRAVNLTPQGDEYMPGRLSNLGNVYQARFDRKGDLDDISKAVVFQQEAIHLIPEGDGSLPTMLSNRGLSYKRRFEYTGDHTDLSEAISSLERAVNLTPEGQAQKAGRLSNLANAYQARFNHTGDLTDISEAISRHQMAVNLTPAGQTDMANRLCDLGNCYNDRFEHRGDLTDISEAISCQQKAVDLTPEGHTEMPTLLSNLGNTYSSRFERLGNLTDISEAILCQQKAVYLTQEGHADMALWMSNLANSYSDRFSRTGDPIDISEAISLQQKAIQLIPKGHSYIPGWLTNLGDSYHARFKHTGNLSDISEAILCHQKSIQLAPESHGDIYIMLINMGDSYRARFQHTGNLTDISEAISSQRKALHLIPAGDAYMPYMLSNLGVSYTARFKQTGDFDDIAEAISSQQRAVYLTPDGHADMPSWQSNLGLSYESRFEHTGDINDIRTAMQNHSLAATYSSGNPSIRLVAAKRWAQISSKYDPTQVVNAYTTAIQLVSRVVGLEQTIKTRHTNLPDMSDLSTSAAAAAFSLARPELALEWLEQGRCLVWSQLNNLRSPLDALRQKDPTLADNIARVSSALEFAGSRAEAGPLYAEASMAQKMSVQDSVSAHVKLAQQWDDLLANARSIPTFERFLQPSPCSTLLQRLPKFGHVIVINVHKDRCDALALVSGLDKPFHIPLPDFSHAKIEDLRNRLNDNLRVSGVRMRDAAASRRGMRFESGGGIGDILRQLWIFVVKPILDGLGYSKPPADLLRIWWCATGPLAFLPIHAAGIYDGPPPEFGSSILDFAISSYTPTVTALVDRVQHPAEHEKKGLFMISQPDTPNFPPIPKTTDEVHAIQRLTEGRDFPVLCLEGSTATVDQAITHMENHSFIHFACHASQDTHEPLKSGFALHDGRLDLSSIIQKRLVGADLAFLSACQTSTGDEKLSEEAVHLAAGMLAAGYHGVVATMWSIHDHYAPEIAEDFYASLIQGEEILTGENAARALHCATEKLRKRLGESKLDLESSLLVWVPYVHFGL